MPPSALSPCRTHLVLHAVVHLGTNDMLLGLNADAVLSTVRTLIDKLQSQVRPDSVTSVATTVLLGSPIGCTLPACARIANELAPRLRALAAELAPRGVFLVDHSVGFDAASMTADGLHPNALGYAALVRACRLLRCNCPCQLRARVRCVRGSALPLNCPYTAPDARVYA